MLSKILFSGIDPNQPDPVKHKLISFGKSAIRIAAGASLLVGSIAWAGILLIVAEILGVVEEMV